MENSEKAAKQAAMRARFPFAAGITDELREVFGPSVAPSYMRQGGDTWGRKLDESRFTVVTAGQMVLDSKRIDEISKGLRRGR